MHRKFFDNDENSITRKLNKKLDSFYVEYFKEMSCDLKQEGKFYISLFNQREQYKQMKNVKYDDLSHELDLAIPQDLKVYFYGLSYSVQEINADSSLAGKVKIPQFNEPHGNSRYLRTRKEVETIKNKYQHTIKLLDDLINELDNYLSKLENIQTKDIFI